MALAVAAAVSRRRIKDDRKIISQATDVLCGDAWRRMYRRTDGQTQQSSRLGTT